MHINYNQSEGKGRVKCSNTHLKKDPVRLTNSRHTRPEILELKVNFVGKQVDRIARRRDVLDNLYDQNSDDDLYDEFLDALIELEEGLVEDNSSMTVTNLD